MAIDTTLGFGTISAGTSASPITVLDLSANSGAFKRNWVTLSNLDPTNWLFLKSADDPGPFKIALPGANVTVQRSKAGNNVTKVIGFAATPYNAGTGTLVAALVADGLL